MTKFGSILQNVLADTVNSTTDNLAAGSIWNSTGSGTSTLGVAGLQVNVTADQNLTVYVDQSQNQIDWDITDSYNYYYSFGGASWTVQATASYVRVRLKNVGSASTTYLRLQTALCPIVEAVPRSLDDEGYLKVGVKSIRGKMGRVRVSPMGSLKVATGTRLAGATFVGTTIDGNFWTTTPTNNGSASQANGELTLTTGTTANGAVLVGSNRIARYTASNPNYYRGNVNAPSVTTSTGSNVRRWGAYDATDGYFFELTQAQSTTATVLGVVSRKGGVDTKVSSGSFNGDWGNSYSLDTNCHNYEAWWTNKSCYLFLDDVLLHTITGATTTSVGTVSLKVGMECINADGNTAANTLVVRNATISRAGNLVSQPTIRYQSGTTAGVICKYGPGNLHGMIISSPVSGSVITLYDGTTTGGTVMYSGTNTIGAQANNLPISLDFKGVPFSTGLFLVVATQNANVTLIFE